MNSLALTEHAAVRMAQRSISEDDVQLIALIGTEVRDGYLVRDSDYQNVERILKKLLQKLRRLRGKRLVVADGRIVTVYHPSNRDTARVLRQSRDHGISLR